MCTKKDHLKAHLSLMVVLYLYAFGVYHLENRFCLDNNFYVLNAAVFWSFDW